MKRLIGITITAMFLASAVVYAHGHSHGDGHNHVKEYSKVNIKNIANKRVQDLVKEEIIDKSWSNTSHDKMEKKEFNHHLEWVVSYKNLKITDESKQTLYVFVTLTGKVVGSNYTGN